MKAVLYLGNRNYSSWSMRGSLLVRQSGLPCEEVVIPLDTVEGKRRILDISPSACVPVLHCEGSVIWDSLSIAEYLHEEFPDAGLWPADADTRAFARSVSAEMHSGFAALREKLPMDVRATHEVAIDQATRQDIERIFSLWTECRERAGDGPFLFGSWSAADAMFAPVVTRFRTYGVALPDVALVYADAVWSHPDMLSLVAEAREEPWSIDLGKMSMHGPRTSDSSVE